VPSREITLQVGFMVKQFETQSSFELQTAPCPFKDDIPYDSDQLARVRRSLNPTEIVRPPASVNSNLSIWTYQCLLSTVSDSTERVAMRRTDKAKDEKTDLVIADAPRKTILALVCKLTCCISL